MSKTITQTEWDYWYSRVYGYFFRRVNERTDVEDLTAATLSDFFLKLEVRNEQGLIWSIARHKLLTFIKYKPRHQYQNLHEMDKEAVTDQTGSFFESKMTHLQECIRQQLSAVDLKIVELSIVSDFSSQRVAAETGFTPANIRQRLSRAVRKLKEKCRNVWIEE